MEGWYFYDIGIGRHLIRQDNSTWTVIDFYDHEIDPDTLSQFTGLKDKNGVKVFFGDKIKARLMPEDLPISGVVEFNEFDLQYCLLNDAGFTPLTHLCDPELMEE